MEKYKNQAIIGHFGLGFYSSFMVADKVEIITKSWKEGAKTVRWSCTGTPEFEMEETDEAHDRGTTIVLHLSEDALEYARIRKSRGCCASTAVSCRSDCLRQGQGVEGRQVRRHGQGQRHQQRRPLWTRKRPTLPRSNTRSFTTSSTHERRAAVLDPLNIDYPFHLTGILYFPKIHNNFEIQKNKIQLYSNQVYVTDQVEGIVPNTDAAARRDRLADIPLNVSRSYCRAMPT